MNTLAFLAQEAPGFAVRGAQVKIIKEPSAFYLELCRRASEAKKRITLSALYLGTGAKEQKLVSAIQSNLERNGGVKVKVLLDYCRGNRVDKDGQSSVSVLKPLLSKYQSNCQVSLYHTPLLRGVWKLLMPAKYNETLGLQHCKVYIFDNSLIISGANLSHDYFTNRQDRYVLIEECPDLADFFDDFIGKMSEFSFQHDGQDNQTKWPHHPYKSSFKDYVTSVELAMKQFLGSAQVKHQSSFPKVDTDIKTNDTWIFPTIQMGVFNIDQDRRVTRHLLEAGQEGSSFKFATGYFNPTNEYLDDIIHKSTTKFDVLMAHPKANGFFGAKFPLSGIPQAYTLLANQFFDSIVANKASQRINLFEYLRPEWTFHGKGLWMTLPGEDLPSLTLIGSPNFGHRSVARDLEAQLAIVTTNEKLRQDLKEEQDGLFDTSDLVSQETFDLKDRLVPRWVKLVVALCRSYF